MFERQVYRFLYVRRGCNETAFKRFRPDSCSNTGYICVLDCFRQLLNLPLLGNEYSGLRDMLNEVVQVPCLQQYVCEIRASQTLGTLGSNYYGAARLYG